MEKYAVVQLFFECHRLNNRNQTIVVRPSFVEYSFITTNLNNVPVLEFGNAHGLSRHYYNQIGYIHDECFATGCDWAYIKAALPDSANYNLEPAWPRYNKTHQAWIKRTKPIFKGKRAFVSGKLYHLDHHSSFPYPELRDMVERGDYNVERDVHKDENNVLYISNKNLATAVERFFMKPR